MQHFRGLRGKARKFDRVRITQTCTVDDRQYETDAVVKLPASVANRLLYAGCARMMPMTRKALAAFHAKFPKEAKEPLIVRSIRLTQKQWDTMEALGGVKWLRLKLNYSSLTPTTKETL